MISFTIDNKKRFNFRIAGVTLYDNKVLLHRMMKDDFWALPGGRCEIFEDTKSALVREYKEEINVDVTIERALFFVENFFSFENEQFHEISVIYNVIFPKETKILSEEEFIGSEKGTDLIFRWFPLSQTKSIELYPSFLKEKLNHLPEHMEHIIHYDK